MRKSPVWMCIFVGFNRIKDEKRRFVKFYYTTIIKTRNSLSSVGQNEMAVIRLASCLRAALANNDNLTIFPFDAQAFIGAVVDGCLGV